MVFLLSVAAKAATASPGSGATEVSIDTLHMRTIKIAAQTRRYMQRKVQNLVRESGKIMPNEALSLSHSSWLWDRSGSLVHIRYKRSLNVQLKGAFAKGKPSAY